MARIRQYKPAFWTDDKVGLLTRDARLCFLGLMSEADDEGRLVDSPKRLAGTIFPFDDDVTAKKLEKWIDELVGQRMVLRYQHEGGRFLFVRNFKIHQKMSHPTPSVLPPPPTIMPRPPGRHSGTAPESLGSKAGGTPDPFAPEGVLVFEGVSEGVLVVEGVTLGLSSSNLNGRGESPVENGEEEEDSRVAEAIALLAHRRRISRTGPPIVDLPSWLARTTDNLRTAYLDDLLAMCHNGTTPDAMANTLEPLSVGAGPSSPPSSVARPDLVWVEDEGDLNLGHWETA